MSPTKPLSPQAQLVWDYLKSSRELTGLIASGTLGVSSVTTRISELRRHADVKAYLTEHYLVLKATWSRDHFGKRYRKYALVSTGAPV